MLHGKGLGRYSNNDQSFLTKKYSEKRKKGLRDKSSFTTAQINLYEISGSEGGGATLETTYEIKQFPFPTDSTIRKKRTIDVRKVKPQLGEMSD